MPLADRHGDFNHGDSRENGAHTAFCYSSNPFPLIFRSRHTDCPVARLQPTFPQLLFLARQMNIACSANEWSRVFANCKNTGNVLKAFEQAR